MKEPEGRGAAGGVESTPDQGGAGGTREPGGASGQMGHGGEGAMVEPVGQRAEAESGPRRLDAELRETPTMVTLEDGSPAELALHRWWAEGEQRSCQTTAVEEAGAGGRAGIFEPPGFQG